MAHPAVNQIRLTARDPRTNTTSSAVVNRHKFETDPAGVAGLCGLLQLALLQRGGSPLDPEYTAELVGPQLSLVATGDRL